MAKGLLESLTTTQVVPRKPVLYNPSRLATTVARVVAAAAVCWYGKSTWDTWHQIKEHPLWASAVTVDPVGVPAPDFYFCPQSMFQERYTAFSCNYVPDLLGDKPGTPCDFIQEIGGYAVDPNNIVINTGVAGDAKCSIIKGGRLLDRSMPMQIKFFIDELDSSAFFNFVYTGYATFDGATVVPLTTDIATSQGITVVRYTMSKYNYRDGRSITNYTFSLTTAPIKGVNAGQATISSGSAGAAQESWILMYPMTHAVTTYTEQSLFSYNNTIGVIFGVITAIYTLFVQLNGPGGDYSPLGVLDTHVIPILCKYVWRTKSPQDVADEEAAGDAEMGMKTKEQPLMASEA
jgi:hypothetical protein